MLPCFFLQLVICILLSKMANTFNHREEWEWKYFLIQSYFEASCSLCQDYNTVIYRDMKFMHNHFKLKHPDIEANIKNDWIYTYFQRMPNPNILKCLKCALLISDITKELDRHLLSHRIIPTEDTSYQSSIEQHNDLLIFCNKCQESVAFITTHHMNHHLFRKHRHIWKMEHYNAIKRNHSD